MVMVSVMEKGRRILSVRERGEGLKGDLKISLRERGIGGCYLSGGGEEGDVFFRVEGSVEYFCQREGGRVMVYFRERCGRVMVSVWESEGG